MTLKAAEFEPKPTYSDCWSCPLHHICEEILCKWQSFIWIIDIFIPIRKEYSSIIYIQNDNGEFVLVEASVMSSLFTLHNSESIYLHHKLGELFVLLCFDYRERNQKRWRKRIEVMMQNVSPALWTEWPLVVIEGEKARKIEERFWGIPWWSRG